MKADLFGLKLSESDILIGLGLLAGWYFLSRPHRNSPAGAGYQRFSNVYATEVVGDNQAISCINGVCTEDDDGNQLNEAYYGEDDDYDAYQGEADAGGGLGGLQALIEQFTQNLQDLIGGAAGGAGGLPQLGGGGGGGHGGGGGQDDSEDDGGDDGGGGYGGGGGGDSGGGGGDSGGGGGGGKGGGGKGGGGKGGKKGGAKKKKGKYGGKKKGGAKGGKGGMHGGMGGKKGGMHGGKGGKKGGKKGGHGGYGGHVGYAYYVDGDDYRAYWDGDDDVDSYVGEWDADFDTFSYYTGNTLELNQPTNPMTSQVYHNVPYNQVNQFKVVTA